MLFDDRRPKVRECDGLRLYLSLFCDEYNYGAEAGRLEIRMSSFITRRSNHINNDYLDCTVTSAAPKKWLNELHSKA